MTVKAKLRRVIKPIPSVLNFKTGSLRRRHDITHEIDFDGDAVVLTPPDASNTYSSPPQSPTPEQRTPSSRQLTVESFWDFSTPTPSPRLFHAAVVLEKEAKQEENDQRALLEVTHRLVQRMEGEMQGLQEEVRSLKQVQQDMESTHLDEINELRQRVEDLEAFIQVEFASNRRAEGSIMQGRSPSLYSHTTSIESNTLPVDHSIPFDRGAVSADKFLLSAAPSLRSYEESTRTTAMSTARISFQSSVPFPSVSPPSSPNRLSSYLVLEESEYASSVLIATPTRPRETGRTSIVHLVRRKYQTGEDQTHRRVYSTPCILPSQVGMCSISPSLSPNSYANSDDERSRTSSYASETLQVDEGDDDDLLGPYYPPKLPQASLSMILGLDPDPISKFSFSTQHSSDDETDSTDGEMSRDFSSLRDNTPTPTPPPRALRIKHKHATSTVPSSNRLPIPTPFLHHSTPPGDTMQRNHSSVLGFHNSDASPSRKSVISAWGYDKENEPRTPNRF